MERAMTMPRYGAGVIHDSSSRFIQQPAPSCNGNAASGAVKTAQDSDSMPVEYRKGVRYRECLKNHAASMGGQAVDGCGEFMPGGEDGSLDGLKCAACGCHRNFHRREAHGEPPCSYCLRPIGIGATPSRQRLPLALPAPPLPLSPPTIGGSPSIVRPNAALGGDNNNPHMSDHYGMPSTVFAAYSNADIQHQQYHHLGSLHFPSSSSSMAQVMKKRFRTKFSNDQKEKLRAFAEKLGWRIQKQDEAAVQQFCMETGVKRHVLKVWMHNNKSNGLGKNLFPVSETFHESVPESA